MNVSRHLSVLIQKGHNVEAKKIIEESNLYNVVDAYKCQLLHYAAQYNNLKMTKYLLRKCCNIDAQDALGYTALMEALERKHIEIIEVLLKAGASVTITNNAEESALKFFFENFLPIPLTLSIFERLLKPIVSRFRQECSNNKEAAKRLLDACCQPDQAIYLKDAKLLECMLQQGLSPSYVRITDFEGEDFKHHTPLHLAVIMSEPEIVKVLLKYGADANVRDERYRTPTYYLYENERNDPNQIEILRFLLGAGASPMLISSTHEQYQCYHTLLHAPVEALRLIFESGLDFDATDAIYGNTILIDLATIERSEIVEALKSCSVEFNVNAPNRNGMRALDFAVLSNNILMVQLLLERGAIINSLGSDNYFPTIFYALGTQCLQSLLENNADPQIVANVNGEAMTIYDYAVKKNMAIEKLKPVVARVALLEKLGTSITELTTSKINSQLLLKEYFQSCQKILDKKIAGNVTLSMLLTADEKKMVKYSNNQELVENEICLGQNQEFELSFSYYSNTLKKLFSKGITNKSMKQKAETMIE